MAESSIAEGELNTPGGFSGDNASAKSRPGITVFFPAYNDALSISGMVEDALNVLPRLTADYEIVVVDDGSQDNTAEVLRNLALKYPTVRSLRHPVNRGYGGALRSGFASAKKELVFYTDGDGQYDATELAKLYPLMRDEVDVVNGYKTSRADSLHRIVLGKLYNRLAHLFFRIPIRDVDCDFRLIRRVALERIKLESSSGIICLEMVRKLAASGARFVETPVTHLPRRYGNSQFFTIRRVARTGWDFFLLWIKLVAKPYLFGSRTPALSLGCNGAVVGSGGAVSAHSTEQGELLGRGQ